MAGSGNYVLLELGKPNFLEQSSGLFVAPVTPESHVTPVSTITVKNMHDNGSLLYLRGPCGFKRKAILILICTNGELVNPNQRRSIATKIIGKQNTKNLNGQTLIVAVDIGKSAHYGYFRAPMGEEVKPFFFSNTHQGFQEFWQRLSRFQWQQGLKECAVGFESTGTYANLFSIIWGANP